MHKLRVGRYHIDAMYDVLGEDRAKTNPERWTEKERQAVGKRQCELRRELGIPHPKFTTCAEGTCKHGISG